MANPFLVLGGIAISVITAAFGILAVPGWVIAAQDASAINDLASAAAADEAAVSVTGGYLNGPGLAAAAGQLGVAFTLSSDVKLCITVSPGRDAFAAVAISPSGAFFARTSNNTEASRGATSVAAITAAGGLPAGVPSPVSGTDCAAGSAVPGGASASPGGGSGSTPGGPALGDPGVAALGNATTIGTPAVATWTNRGVFAVSSSNAFLQSSGGRAHEVTFTGAVADAASLFAYNGIASDGDGNLYFSGVGPFGDGGDYKFVIFKVAPDNSSTVIAMMNPSSPPRVKSTAVGTVYYSFNKQLHKLNSSGTFDVVDLPAQIDALYDNEWSGGAFAGEDAAGNLYFVSAAFYYTVTPGGAVTTRPVLTLSGGGWGHAFTVGVSADGTWYKAEHQSVARVGADGLLTPIVEPGRNLPGWNNSDELFPFISGFDSDGNIILHSFQTASGIQKLTPSGTLSVIVQKD